MKFKAEELEDRIFGNSIKDEIIDHRRWSVVHSMVFEHEGRYYRTTYNVPATESQECEPFGYGVTEVEYEEVIPVQRSFTVYIPVEKK